MLRKSNKSLWSVADAETMLKKLTCDIIMFDLFALKG